MCETKVNLCCKFAFSQISMHFMNHEFNSWVLGRGGRRRISSCCCFLDAEAVSRCKKDSFLLLIHFDISSACDFVRRVKCSCLFFSIAANDSSSSSFRSLKIYNCEWIGRIVDWLEGSFDRICLEFLCMQNRWIVIDVLMTEKNFKSKFRKRKCEIQIYPSIKRGSWYPFLWHFAFVQRYWWCCVKWWSSIVVYNKICRNAARRRTWRRRL